MLILRLYKKYLIPIFLYITNLIIQNYNLGKVAFAQNDEGVYLYSAKLLNEGFIPYKDFFLAQSAFLIYAAGFLLKSVSYNIELFRLLYTCWVFSIIFPIFFIVLKSTKSILASTLSIILFSTFSELVQWDMHSFALRQASLPFLAFAIYFIYIRSKQITSGLLLGLFAISLVSNLLISVCFIFLSIGEEVLNRKGLLKILKENSQLIFTFTLICILGYLPILLIPEGYGNLIGYQLERPPMSYYYRIQYITLIIENNWPILLFGFLGSFIVKNNIRYFGLFNIISFIIVAFLGNSFYPHYLSILAFGLAITSGFLIKNLGRTPVLKIIISCMVLISIFISSYTHLKTYLINVTTPNFFKLVYILKSTPEPLFTFEPIYGLYAKKNLTFHYYVTDMRYFRVLYKNLDEQSYLRELKKSRTILLEPFALAFIPPSIRNYIDYNFRSVYSDGINTIYVKKP